MARPLRRDLPDGTFHVVTRGVFRTPIHRDRADYLAHLELLARAVGRWGWEIDALCLMPTHHHLVLRSTREALSRGMHDVNGAYARLFNRRHERHGHLFGDRFVARVIRDDHHLRTVCRYVIGNPVRAGLCDDVADWPWTRSRYGIADAAT
jgi:REP element-mobilizing transposase RayT